MTITKERLRKIRERAETANSRGELVSLVVSDIPDLLDACLAQAALLGEAQEVLRDWKYGAANRHTRRDDLLAKLDATT